MNNNSVACLIDTNGVRTNIASLSDVPITREVELAFRWDDSKQEYSVVFPAGLNNLAILSVATNEIKLLEVIEGALVEETWPTTGIACQFVNTVDEIDLWEFNRKILFVYNEENTNDAIYQLISLENLTDVFATSDGLIPKIVILHPAYPNPFNPTTKIKFSIPNNNYVQLDIFNIQGVLISNLFQNNLLNGTFEIEWNGKNSLGKKVSS